MTGQEETLRDLAGLFVSAAAGRHDAPHYAARLAGTLGIGRDAGTETVKEALGKALGLAVGPAVPSLGERVTSVLTAAGFREYDPSASASVPAFLVAEGVGVTVNLLWAANDDMRSRALAKFAERLRADGLEVEDRDRYLYVHEPKKAGQEAATAAGTGN